MTALSIVSRSGTWSASSIPCLYYCTEQGLSGHGNDEAVREALCGGPGFDQGSFFYRAIQAFARVRSSRSALRYGRFYFRPVSAAADGQTFAITSFQKGVLAFSGILNDEEVVVAANTNTAADQAQAVDVIVDGTLNEVNDQYQILHSNKPTPATPRPAPANQ